MRLAYQFKTSLRLVLTVYLVLLNIQHADAVAKTQPNIILISADDLGFDDLGINGNPIVTTPSLDLLAQQSVKFTDFAVSPVCSTTRASLLTGRQFYRTGVSGVHGGRDYLNRDETLLPQMLKQQGYASGTWGKWHLGKSQGYMPWERGFDQAYYAELYQHKASTGWLNGEKVVHQAWVSQVITDYAIEFIKDTTHQQKPFFAYLSYLAPHEPWLAPDEYVQPYLKQGLRPAIANIYGMVSEMDFQIGRLLAFLEQQGLNANTVVIFMSDNGPWWDSSNLGALTKQEWQDRNPSKLKGNKGQTWQNGVKSPLFVRLGLNTKHHSVTRYVEVTDILPTILDLTGSTLPANNKPVDGLSFLNYLNGDSQRPNPRQHLIASHDLQSDSLLFNQWTPVDTKARSMIDYKKQMIGLRTEQYKLILNPAMDRANYPSPQNHYLLFDMQTDPLETQNIFAQQPALSAQLVEVLQTKFSEIVTQRTSFATPIFTIGSQPISVINAFAPSATSGNTQSAAHFLGGMKQAADSATFDIEVINAGTYRLYIEQLNTDAAGLLMQISVGNNDLNGQFNGDLLQSFGDINLSTGTTQLTLSVKGSNSIKPWAQISQLRRIYLVQDQSNLSKKDILLLHSNLPQ
jgi:arylsulfatase A-like enzyme